MQDMKIRIKRVSHYKTVINILSALGLNVNHLPDYCHSIYVNNYGGDVIRPFSCTGD
jgi:hypothetical protein